jgi:hypothetical protein
MSVHPSANPVPSDVAADRDDSRAGLWTGTLHCYVAFDWGDEVDLDHARRLVPAEFLDLPRRRRTPTSFSYRPPPLRFGTGPVALDLPEIGPVSTPGEVTLFDFGALSVAVQVPFRLSAAALSRVAGWLADPGPALQAARTAVVPFHQRLLPAIEKAVWQEDFSEEYFVFQLYPDEPDAGPAALLGPRAGWLAGLLRLDAGPLSAEETAEALRLHLSYSPTDLLAPDWGAAVLLDRDCGETLQTVEFANLQLLEFRHIDSRLDADLAAAYRLIHSVAQSRLPFWRSPARSLRALGELKVEANSLFERTENVLKLVGDQYLARVYRLLSGRFHLEEWERSIQRKLEVIEGVYQVIADQSATYRTEFLELIVIGLILLEIVLAVFHH